jgi:murein DD-endopeptidase MepM/ murein hydrolase activator NlpD
VSLVRPVVAGTHSQGKISQPFLGDFAWESPAFVKTGGLDRGARYKWVTTATYRPKAHLAIDYICAIGTHALAVKSGTIIGQGKDSSGALFTYLRVRNGATDQVVALYYHLSAFLHPIGASVVKGSAVALTGNSGYSTGAHLHFELIRAPRGASLREIFDQGVRLDPQPFIDGTASLRQVAP